MASVRVGQQDGIGVLTLDRKAKLNALSRELVDELIAGLTQLQNDAARAVILRALPGVKVWSSGHDVDELPEGRDPLGWADPLRNLVRAIENFPAPVIALVEGSVWGGACEVVLASDIIIATPDASFSLTPARIGVPYNISGMMTFMHAASLHVVKELVFTAKPMDAARAERLGMVNHVVAAHEIEDFTRAMARDIAANAPLAIQAMKEQLRILAGAYPVSPRGFEKVQGLRQVVIESADYREGIRAFKDKRKAVFKGE